MTEVGSRSYALHLRRTARNAVQPYQGVVILFGMRIMG